MHERASQQGGHLCRRAGVLGDVCLEGTCLGLWAGGSCSREGKCLSEHLLIIHRVLKKKTEKQLMVATSSHLN